MWLSSTIFLVRRWYLKERISTNSHPIGKLPRIIAKHGSYFLSSRWMPRMPPRMSPPSAAGYMQVYIYIYRCIYVYRLSNVQYRVYAHIYISLSLYIYIYISIHIYIYIYIYTGRRELSVAQAERALARWVVSYLFCFSCLRAVFLLLCFQCFLFFRISFSFSFFFVCFTFFSHFLFLFNYKFLISPTFCLTRSRHI